MISVQCPIPFGGAHHFFPCEGSNQRSTCGENIQISDQPIRGIGINFHRIQNGFKCRIWGLTMFFRCPSTPGWNFQFHQPKKSGHVSNIQSSSFASSWMSWPWPRPRLQLLEFQSLVLRQKFLVPVLTWHGLSRVLHDPPDVW